ncbi:arsenate reductase family protein [Beduini massiliensis]|uniref:arsenate reductase family protein n=1 Tax=Beduini massiliensis TaxID=1585974 RepID=UPI00059A99D0|nr:arsenate reductase family protein [Beduini massiliensis]
MLFIEYPKCSTCQKAKKFLINHGADFDDRHIVENTPIAAELKQWIERSGLPTKRFFNTSGNVYKEMNLKEKVDLLTIDEACELLSQNGMLIKRPLLITEDTVLVGFKESEYEMIIK